MDALKRKRATIKSSLTKFSKYFVDNRDNLEKTLQIKCRFEVTETLLSEFNRVQDEIDSIEGVNKEAESIERDNFEDLYFDIIASVREFLNPPAPISNISNGQSSTSSIHSESILPASSLADISVRLPAINLPSFNGKFDRWLEFYDTFSALVHNNGHITDIQKFYYLKTSLKDEAANLINTIEVSAANYSVAWILLKERYHNTKIIISKHINELLNMPVINNTAHIELRSFIDCSNRHIRSLKALGELVENWGTLLIHILLTKVDFNTRKEWEFKSKDEDITLDSLFKFLNRRCEVLETIGNSHSFVRQSTKKISSSHAVSTQLGISSEISVCPICRQKSRHSITACFKFLKLTPLERFSKIKSMHRCYNCLSEKHSAHTCNAGTCATCHLKHHTLLHIEKASVHQAQPDSSNAQIGRSLTMPPTHSVGEKTYGANDPCVTDTQVSGCSQSSGQIILSTAVALATNTQGVTHTCRILLDSASQPNFISASCVDRLGLNTIPIKIEILGVNQTKSSVDKCVKVKLMSLDRSFQLELKCLVVQKVTNNLPSRSFPKELLKIPEHLELVLADPNFNMTNKIDILLGAGSFYDIMLAQKYSLGSGLPILQETKFGWVVGGGLDVYQGQFSSHHCLSSFNTLAIDLQQFWELENYDKEDLRSAVDKDCEEHFIQHVNRTVDGRFRVFIPFLESINKLADSRSMALRRYFKLENRLQKDPSLRQDYCNFMREYSELGHMRKLCNESKEPSNYYLPHHPVVNLHSITTKLRVVFDGSAVTASGLSLNSVQMVGPKIQADIFDILLRFRVHRYVLTADISKMYRRILIDESQYKYQRIFWRDNPSLPLECYELVTVTYGTASAPFLAVRCLQQLGVESKKSYALESEIIKRDFYVDDLLTGADTKSSLEDIKRNLTKILADAGFPLCKWASNVNIDSTDPAIIACVQVGEKDNRKTLGVWWNTTTDKLEYRCEPQAQPDILCKRSILSNISKLYDPLGLVGPIVIIAKILIQALWLQKQGWDDPVSDEIKAKWLSFLEELANISNIRIPRLMLIIERSATELHGFCDASEQAYGACVYLKSLNSLGQYQISLVCAKSRVAPLKTISLPRLELCGAVLLANLVRKVLKELNLEIENYYLWSDSTITLHWIKSEPNLRKIFVANRVAFVQELTDVNKWFHVGSSDNPADMLSRGLAVSKLENNSLWWSGPEWLKYGEADWPVTRHIRPEENLPETRTISNVVETVNEFYLFSMYSQLSKLIRITALCFRFSMNCKNQLNKLVGPLTVKELFNANAVLIRTIHKSHFANDYKMLLKYGRVDSKSKLLKLSPFLDGNNIIRVGGRLVNSTFGYNKNHPILLPSKHMFTILVFREYHKNWLHCGPQALLAAVREKYWPIAGRNIARQTVHNCIVCYRVSPRTDMPIMGALPKDRVTPAPPFYVCGVDYAGPIMISDKKSRGAKKIKSYICLFICFTTKAVHLEVVSELSTERFLSALHRFTARRGRPSKIYSDNGTNFVGAAAELGRFLRSYNGKHIADALLNDGITWQFIPPNSPHFGGLWEAGVKSTKYHLNRVMGNSSMIFEEFYTMVVQIEAVLNSRPISPLSSDPNDLSPLTPAHFLIGQSILDVPEPDYRDVRENRLSRYERVQQLVQHFWTRWSKEYVSELQQRSKWKTSAHLQLKVGSMVVVRDDCLPPKQWRLGRYILERIILSGWQLCVLSVV